MDAGINNKGEQIPYLPFLELDSLSNQLRTPNVKYNGLHPDSSIWVEAFLDNPFKASSVLLFLENIFIKPLDKLSLKEDIKALSKT